MGLDTSHDAWHGAYSAFMRWREKIAEVAGLPPLQLMEGFFVPQRGKDQKEWDGTISTIYLGPNTDELTRNAINRIEATLPIRWEALKPSPLHELLYHSDCDGELPAASCGPIADELEKLLPLLPDGDGGGHIGVWRSKTQQFIDGLRSAAAANEPLGFH
jgi:hypothetical protein